MDLHKKGYKIAAGTDAESVSSLLSGGGRGW